MLPGYLGCWGHVARIYDLWGHMGTWVVGEIVTRVHWYVDDMLPVLLLSTYQVTETLTRSTSDEGVRGSCRRVHNNLREGRGD